MQSIKVGNHFDTKYEIVAYSAFKFLSKYFNKPEGRSDTHVSHGTWLGGNMAGTAFNLARI